MSVPANSSNSCCSGEFRLVPEVTRNLIEVLLLELLLGVDVEESTPHGTVARGHPERNASKGLGRFRTVLSCTVLRAHRMSSSQWKPRGCRRRCNLRSRAGRHRAWSTRQTPLYVGREKGRLQGIRLYSCSLRFASSLQNAGFTADRSGLYCTAKRSNSGGPDQNSWLHCTTYPSKYSSSCSDPRGTSPGAVDMAVNCDGFEPSREVFQSQSPAELGIRTLFLAGSARKLVV